MKLSLSRKPEATAWSIEQILEKVRDGEVRLPEFQRLFKWTGDDVLNLFDSIVRGFPIGTFLFWKAPPASMREGRPLEISASTPVAASSDLLFVLDGQQRVTSLAGVLLATEAPSDDRFRIAFALDRDELIRVPSSEEWPEFALPLFHTLDPVNLNTWVAAQQGKLSPATQRRAFEVGKAIRDYRVPAYIVVADAEETARLIFDRTNASGKSLTKAEVFKGLHEGLQAQRPNSLEGLEKSVEDLGFGPLRDNLFLQAAAAVAGLDVTKMDHGALSSPALGAALPATAAALRKALVFLRHDAHIPNADLLPYGFPVVALSRFFFLHPQPQPRSRDLLSRWVWRGALTHAHWAHEQAYLRETLRALQGADEEGEVQRMLSLLPKRPGTAEPGEYSLKSARTRLNLLALLDLRPRDLATGELLDGAALVLSRGSAAVQLLADENSGDPLEDAARATLYGRIIQRPMSRQRLLSLLGGLYATEAVVASLGLDAEDLSALFAGRGFAVRRAAKLSKHVLDFFQRKARWSETDRPSLRSMLIEDSP
jgi:hypothetical protein